jgi:hypothetical protein
MARRRQRSMEGRKGKRKKKRSWSALVQIITNKKDSHTYASISTLSFYKPSHICFYFINSDDICFFKIYFT